MLNAGYGALANEYFLYYEVENAEAITMTGQLVNKWTCQYVDDFLKSIFSLDDSTWAYSDTDSVGGDSLVNVNGVDVKISDLFDDVVSKGGDYLKNDKFNQKWVVKPNNNIKTPSVGKDGDVNISDVKYVMKHKVKKKMYRLEVGGESVKVTEDHSLMVKRKGRIVSSKVEDITEGDKIIMIDA